jgi:hypothetical protein
MSREEEFNWLARHVKQARINSGPSQAEVVARGFADMLIGYDAEELLRASETAEPLQWG